MQNELSRRAGFWNDLLQRTNEYQKTRANRERALIQETTLAFLLYLNMKWLADGKTSGQTLDGNRHWSPFSSRRSREIIQNATGHPFLRRLQFIKQLGTTSLHQRVDASHTRWSHSIGTAECVGKFLDALDNNHCSVGTPEEVIALVVGALVHDALHCPWGHSLEPAGSLFVPEGNLVRQTRFDKLLFKQELELKDSPLREIIRLCLGSLDETAVVKTLLKIIDKNKCRRDYPESYYLAQILDYEIDADRLDFLRRDGVHTHMSPPLLDQWSDIIDCTKTEWLRDPLNSAESVPLRRLVFDVKHKDTIRDILGFRRDMYDRVYEHRHKIVLDDMLAHALFYAMKRSGIVPEFCDRTRKELAWKAVKEILTLIDEDLINFILEVSDSSVEGRQARELVLDIYRDRPYLEIPCTFTISRDKMKTVESNLLHGKNAFVEAVKTNAGKTGHANLFLDPWEARKQLNRTEFLELGKSIFEELTKQGKWGKYEDLTFFDFHMLRGDFLKKHQEEQSFWRRLVGIREFKSILTNYISTRYGVCIQEEQIEGQYLSEEVPLVHISLTGYSRHTAKEMQTHATEFGGEKRLAFYNDDIVDNCSSKEHALDSKCKYTFWDSDLATAEGFEIWNIILSAPAELTNDPRAQQIIREQWEKFMFTDRVWITGIY